MYIYNVVFVQNILNRNCKSNSILLGIVSVISDIDNWQKVLLRETKLYNNNNNNTINITIYIHILVPELIINNLRSRSHISIQVSWMSSRGNQYFFPSLQTLRQCSESELRTEERLIVMTHSNLLSSKCAMCDLR